MTDSPPRHTADTINDNALDALYARIETLEHVAAGNKRHVQLIVPDLERAEATLARVRALRDNWLLMTLEPGQVRRLLDQLTHAIDGEQQ
jgi:hypothetical protein